MQPEQIPRPTAEDPATTSSLDAVANLTAVPELDIPLAPDTRWARTRADRDFPGLAEQKIAKKLPLQFARAQYFKE